MMRQAMGRTLLLIPACLLVLTGGHGWAYLVANSASLDELERSADLICKAQVVASDPVEDAWFDKVHGFGPQATRLQIISVLKGGPTPKTISFHHYARRAGQGVSSYSPQQYRFQAGRAYIVFAKKTSDPTVFRQIWKQHRAKGDQGLLLASDEKPISDKTLSAVFWTELTGLLESQRAGDATYAIGQLDHMSGGAYEDLKHFDRAKVLAAIGPLMTSKDDKVASAAITSVGSRNPYMSEEYASHWLASFEGSQIEGFSKWDRDKVYSGAKSYWKELAAIVDGDAPVPIRALAIRALGRAQRTEVLGLVKGWITDPAPEIRQAATLLLGDYTKGVDADTLGKLAADPSPLVRRAATLAIGFGRLVDQLPLLGKLLHDSDPKVCQAAAMSLLSFPVGEVGDILRAELDHPQYAPLFVNALASQDPQPHLKALGWIIHKQPQPDRWWGGRIPWGVSWEILFRYVQKQPAARLRSGSLDDVLGALESPTRDMKSGRGFYSSSEPRDLYALYLQKGLKKRAQAFRVACRRAASYDMDYYFDMVDKDPSTYQRR